MKNQYFGDVNDYRKYGLLRALLAGNEFRLLVAWMLTPDDEGRDGELRSYLSAPDQWSKHDPELLAGLRSLLSAGQRSTSLLEGSDLLPRASFHSALVPDDLTRRQQWRTDLLRAAAGVDLAFLDPDNGIETSSKPPGRAGSSKFAAWAEIEGLWAEGCSVLVYQHFRREPREAFIERIAGELRSRTGSGFVEAFRTPHVVFLLAAQPRHSDGLAKAIATMADRWEGQIEALGLAPRSRN
ncbi:MAG: hypothetical protein HUU28_04885 [Planctomycetaceae bacterium]|nr:hypothetical protein [Planctomycetaceae bacterium]